jgi:hypothetical protein
MASYDTHVVIALVTTTATTGALYGTGFFEPSVLIPALLCGYLGGIFPDIDSTTGKPIEIITNILVVIVIASLWNFTLQNYQNVLDYGSLFLTGSIFLIAFLIKKPLVWFLGKAMRHRGITHSLLAIAVFQSFLVILLEKFYGIQAKEAAFLGVIFSVGYITHLLLDELYSVDFQGRTLKKSFGTAFKLFPASSRADVIRTFIFIFLLGVTSKHLSNPPIAQVLPSGDLGYLSQNSLRTISFYEALVSKAFWERVIGRLV